MFLSKSMQMHYLALNKPAAIWVAVVAAERGPPNARCGCMRVVALGAL
jgi:hypothetical protein